MTLKPTALRLMHNGGNHHDIMRSTGQGERVIGRAVKIGQNEWEIWYGGSPVELFAGTLPQLRRWLAIDPSCLQD